LKLSIIIVNFRSSKYIVDCIESALKCNADNPFEWIVVDNHSGDDSKSILQSKFPFIKWIDMQYNAGFARANNEGIRQSSGDVVLLLNPDTIIQNNALERCFQRFITTDDVACGVQLLNLDGTPQISGNFFMKGGINHLLALPYWGNFLRWIAFAMKTKKPNVLEAGDAEKVDWISGAFLMVKKSSIAKTGMMDEDFFLYAEEIEWCSRLKKIGNLSIYGDIKMVHLLGETIKDATQTEDKTYFNLFDKKGLQLLVSNHVRIRKQFGVFWFFVQLLNCSFGVPVFFVCSFIDHLFHLQNPFADWKRIKGLGSNVFELWKLMPTMLSNRPHFYKFL
jgi:hypothetical protein